MEFLTEEELRRFRRTSLVGRETRVMFREALDRKFVLVESAASDVSPSMIAGIGVSRYVVDEFRKLSEMYGSLKVLSAPEFSKMSILGIWKRKYICNFIPFKELLDLKRERFDPELRRLLNRVEPKKWRRTGRRPKYSVRDEIVVGLFGTMFPYTRRETYLIFKLPTVRELFGVSGDMSFTNICYSAKLVDRLLHGRAGREYLSSAGGGGGGLGGYLRLLLGS